MNRMGNCWDNTPMESFFSTLKHELIHHEYIEVVNNRQRSYAKLGYVSPVVFQVQHYKTKTA